MNIRLAKPEDLPGIQATNLQNLPENYLMKFWMYHILRWPQISFVAEDHKGRIVGYVLAKIDDGEYADVDEKTDFEGGKVYGHVNSISVLRPYRRLGLARKLMILSQEAMSTIYKASFVSLHVRKSNKPAIALYRDSLGFGVAKVEHKYYGDGEDALSMRLDLSA
ncbi:acyl-CoA N-acyltransferase [Mycena galopus ATCC 62051]|nr:acyl-CoA N-acyltransferase [Mycena galopus ATCC 62051]